MRGGNGQQVNREGVTRVVLVPGNVWRIGLVVIGLIVLFAVGRFVLGEGASLIFTAVMAWFISLAMEPAVSRLARHMPRGAATGLVLLAVVLFLVVFYPEAFCCFIDSM